MSDHDILFIPGPVEVDPELREIMAMPLMGHRQPAFIEEVKAVCGKLKAFFLTNAYTLFENCPATALMDASVRNLVGERILHCVGGAFAERWFAVSEACGRKPEALSVEWGEVVTPDALREKLTSSPSFEAVAITYSETSTGARAPLKELAAVVREVAPETLILVDAVSAVGGIELRFDEWGIDLAFAGTQKCLALPPGLCVYALSERALEKAKTVPDR
ncbi:MAG: aminotransferase class V-fold PLP-dependent enzyme, partial [Planctomycetota bacterium]|nr:aminotransferase class V-fold PLP-dependent enzyme [Planctomycetota bacterium]